MANGTPNFIKLLNFQSLFDYVGLGLEKMRERERKGVKVKRIGIYIHHIERTMVDKSK